MSWCTVCKLFSAFLAACCKQRWPKLACAVNSSGRQMVQFKKACPAIRLCNRQSFSKDASAMGFLLLQRRSSWSEMPREAGQALTIQRPAAPLHQSWASPTSSSTTTPPAQDPQQAKPQKQVIKALTGLPQASHILWTISHSRCSTAPLMPLKLLHQNLQAGGRTGDRLLLDCLISPAVRQKATVQLDAWASIIDDGATTNRLPFPDAHSIAQAQLPEHGQLQASRISLSTAAICCGRLLEEPAVMEMVVKGSIQHLY